MIWLMFPKQLGHHLSQFLVQPLDPNEPYSQGNTASPNPPFILYSRCCGDSMDFGVHNLILPFSGFVMQVNLSVPQGHL